MTNLKTNHTRWLSQLCQKFISFPKNRQELIQLLQKAQENNIIDSAGLHMIEKILAVAEMHVRDIMIPRAQMVFVTEDAKPKDILPILIDSQHSRFPVLNEKDDTITGLLLAKDLVRYIFQKAEDFQVKSILRPVVFIPESKRLNVLLDEFRLNRNHMAIVIDEYGNTAGLVTIEDVLEEIVGEIADEYDVEENINISKLSKNQYLVKAFTPIEEFNQQFQTQFSDADFDTIGGIVTHFFGHLPKRGESINIENMQFKVLHADKRKPRLFRVKLGS